MYNEKKSDDFKVKIYFSNALEDELSLLKLERHLTILNNENLIDQWQRNKIVPGENIEEVSNSFIQKAEIIILLLSPDFFATDYIYNYEMEMAIERHKSGACYLFPIYLRSVDYSSSILADFRIYPSKEHPVYSSFWETEDHAFLEVVKDLKKLVYEIRNIKQKETFIQSNYKLIDQRYSTESIKEKREIDEKLSKIFISQNIIAPFDCLTSINPVIGTKKDPEIKKWSIETYDNIEFRKSYLSKEVYPSMILIDYNTNTPFTVYLQNHAEIEENFLNKDLIKKGEIVQVVKIPLLAIIENRKKDSHWSISRGDTRYAGVLTYQPDLKFWKEDLKVRFRGLDRKYGCFNIKADYAGILQRTKPISIGEEIKKDEVIANLKTENKKIEIKSPVNGTTSLTLQKSEKLIYKGQNILSIRTHPPLLMVEVDYSISWSGLYTCMSPISGKYVSTVPMIQKSKTIEEGKEIEQKTIVCGIKNEDLMVAIYVNECVGRILEVFHEDGDEVKIGEKLFMIAPKFLLIRSPMVGTFYRSPKPWEPPFIELGQQVRSGEVVCLIEAMKSDNEIESDILGKVVEIYPLDSTHVEYEQELFKVQMYED